MRIGECRLVTEQIRDMTLGLMEEAWHKRIEGSVGFQLSHIDVELVAADQVGFLAQIDDPLEEALEDFDA
jgi:hypothetical protein